MAQPTQAKAKTKAEQEAQQKALRRAEQANILAGVRPLLEENEQLLAFARSRVAGGWRGKLNVGPEAFFAPYTNVALTERRFLVQHVHHSNGKPSEMLPHSYALGTIARVTFTDIETYGGEPACRLVLHLENGLYVRLRLRGRLNFDSAKTIAELFDTLTVTRKPNPLSPTQSTCPACRRILDMASRFCPYCGTQQPQTASNTGPVTHTGLTLATDDEEDGGQKTEDGEQTQSSIVNRQPSIVRQETDFAYERGDLPAEFGTALPLPDKTSPPSEGERVPEESGLSVEDNAGRAEEDGNTATPNSDTLSAPTLEDEDERHSFMDLSVFTPDETEAVHGTSAEAQAGESEGEINSESTPGAGSREPAAEVEFGQYDAQQFAELPFQTVSGAGDNGGSQTRFETAEEADDIVRDDETDAFLPPHPSASALVTGEEAREADRDTTRYEATSDDAPTNDGTLSNEDLPLAALTDTSTAEAMPPDLESATKENDTIPESDPTHVPENAQEGSASAPAFPPSDDHHSGDSQP